MLIKFKSKAAADVLMYEEHAKRILDLLGKEVARGVIRSEEMPQAVERLEKEIGDCKRHAAHEEVKRDALAHQGETGEESEQDPVEFVSFATRAYPLLEMMRAAKHDHVDVMWGV